jgi:hypothetical protein
MNLTTGSQALDLIVAGVGVLVVVYVVRCVYAAREGIGWTLVAVLRGLAGYFLAALVLAALGQPREQIVLGGYLGAGLAVASTKRRSRYIRKSVKRNVIAKHLAKGSTYDPHEHQIDHTFPFAKGGSNTEDNLRVIPKKKNLKKGAKLPSIFDWF